MAKLTPEATYTDEELLALWRACYAEISVKGQSYQINGRIFTRANLKEVREQISWLENRIAQASSGIRVVPIRLKRAR